MYDWILGYELRGIMNDTRRELTPKRYTNPMVNNSISLIRRI